MPKYRVPVSYTVDGFYTVECDSLDDIDEKMDELNRAGKITIGDITEESYRDDSFEWFDCEAQEA